MLDAQTYDLIQVVPVKFPSGTKELSGTLFRPRETPRAAVVLNPATGVPQGYYRHFARWMAADRGLAVLTYDYAGMGASASGPVRDCDATMQSWALIDQPAARKAMRGSVPEAPLWVIGHSLGALMLPMQQDISDIERVIAVASGYVHFRDHPWPYQGLARLFWFGHVPVLTKLLGYTPTKRLGLGEDLPPGAYWQWRKWCTSETFFWPDVGKTLPQPNWTAAPVRLVTFADDQTIPSQCSWRLERSYRAECCTRIELDPATFGLSHVGHIAAFARKNAAIWPALLGHHALLK